MNHASHDNIISLAREGKIDRRILKVKKAPTCPSCLFGRVYKRLWRTTKKYSHISKEGLNPGEEVSIDQVVMSHPGMVPQSHRKLTTRKYVSSQICTDHHIKAKHVFYMQDFTTTEIIEGKREYKRFIERHRRSVKKYRADNGRYTDEEFLNEVKNKKQNIEFCAVGAHHQNEIAK